MYGEGLVSIPDLFIGCRLSEHLVKMDNMDSFDSLSVDLEKMTFISLGINFVFSLLTTGGNFGVS